MHEKGVEKIDKRNILILPRDPQIRRTLQERLNGNRELLEDPSTETARRNVIAHELPILERLFDKWSVNFWILRHELENRLGEEFNPDLFSAARSFVLAVCTTDES